MTIRLGSSICCFDAAGVIAAAIDACRHCWHIYCDAGARSLAVNDTRVLDAIVSDSTTGEEI